ncbi:hypothetical protein [Streptomyces sp. NPDC058622]|uniref:hypothetical protein n=1 Tax=Streptomyces sp. NPDC058622 TaxID=3346562 RepID=UPI003667CFBA
MHLVVDLEQVVGLVQPVLGDEGEAPVRRDVGAQSAAGVEREQVPEGDGRQQDAHPHEQTPRGAGRPSG